MAGRHRFIYFMYVVKGLVIVSRVRVCVSNGVFTRWSKDETTIKQTHEANLEHTSCMCIFSTFALFLLHPVNTL